MVATPLTQLPLSSKLLLSAIVLLACVGSLSGCAHDDRLSRWESANHAAFCAFRDNKYEQAVQKYELAISVGKEIGPDDDHVLMAQVALAQVYSASQHLALAGKIYAEAVSAFAKLPEARMAPEVVLAYCDALKGLAQVQQRLGHTQISDYYFQRALWVATRAHLSAKIQDITFEYGIFKNTMGCTSAACTNAGKSGADMAGDLNDSYKSLCACAEENFRNRRFDRAMKKYLEASALAEKMHSPTGQACCALQLGAVFNAKNDLHKAEQSYRFAEKLLASGPVANADELKACRERLTAILIRQGKGRQAVAVALAVREMAQKNHSLDDHEIIEAESALALAFISEGVLTKAAASLNRSEALTRRHYPVCSASVIMYSCWISHIHFLNGRADLGRKRLADLVAELHGEPLQNLELPARLYNDYGQEMTREGYARQSPEYYRAALAVLQLDPHERLERDRAKRLLRVSGQSRQVGQARLDN